MVSEIKTLVKLVINRRPCTRHLPQAPFFSFLIGVNLALMMQTDRMHMTLFSQWKGSQDQAASLWPVVEAESAIMPGSKWSVVAEKNEHPCQISGLNIMNIAFAKEVHMPVGSRWPICITVPVTDRAGSASVQTVEVHA